MTWSYSDTSSADLDVVRRYTGDTNTNTPLLTDEEIALYIAGASNLHSAAADAIEHGILPQIARDVDSSGAGLTNNRSQKTTHYRDMIESLRRSGGALCEAYAGGMSIAADETFAADTDLVTPAFTRNMHGNS